MQINDDLLNKWLDDLNKRQKEGLMKYINNKYSDWTKELILFLRLISILKMERIRSCNNLKGGFLSKRFEESPMKGTNQIQLNLCENLMKFKF